MTEEHTIMLFSAAIKFVIFLSNILTVALEVVLGI